MLKMNFRTQIERLKRTYGQDCYPMEVVLALESELSGVSDERFKKAIDRVLASNPNPKFPPGLKKIEEELAMMRDEDQEQRIKKQREEESQNYVNNNIAQKELGKIMEENFGN